MYADPCAYRYFDYPRPGSIYTLPDIPSLVRGPTLVLMPSGKEIRVPDQMKQMVASPAETHDVKDGQGKMQELLKLLTAKQGPSAPSGFKIGRAGAFQQALVNKCAVRGTGVTLSCFNFLPNLEESTSQTRMGC